ncbi:MULTISPECIES: hypothetical protein [Brevibacillus]|uniref:hypothetical protein n=1 Tax=Brevibacillus TaxID=55080 RepID=UPI000D0F99BF|nr:MULTISPECIES: hypothetical protein [Brevibacillus]MED1948096.1 hypothetical protein [Brevibacillus formosus]MED1998173.1 hypothetical protein [Brevibacillus formosus]MED2080714.1 hypothetical protein [Brevibacillus formosus]PSK20612.1 hypothetical protein C7R94_04260 [Brevibacillus sp. NRRL NRS-603]
MYPYVNQYGETVTKKEQTITDAEFRDSNSLTRQQITDIMNNKNKGLVERGFAKAVYELAQKKGINPKVILATLCSRARVGKKWKLSIRSENSKTFSDLLIEGD